MRSMQEKAGEIEEAGHPTLFLVLEKKYQHCGEVIGALASASRLDENKQRTQSENFS